MCFTGQMILSCILVQVQDLPKCKLIKDFSLKNVNGENGYINDMIHGILEDNNGCIWLSTNKGLIKYNPNNKFSHKYFLSGRTNCG